MKSSISTMFSVLLLSLNLFADNIVKRTRLADGSLRFDIKVPASISSRTPVPNRTFEFDMGDIPVGKTADGHIHWYTEPEVLTQHVYVSFAGSNEMAITSDGCTGAELHFGAPCEIYFKYTPTTKGIAKAVITVDWQSDLPGGDFYTATHTHNLTGSSYDCPVCNKSKASGSIIHVSDQTLGEVVPVVGAPFQLYYSSEFAAEYVNTTAQFTTAFGFRLEGWTPSIHHLYSKDQHRLFLGSGTAQARQYTVLSNNNLMVTSSGGDEVYIFSPTGKHLETRTFLTGALKYTFTYDSNDRLIRITDTYRKSTEITRNSSGLITAITGPFGQTTSFASYSSGLFSSVTNPNSETYSFTYKSGTSLLETFTKPGGQVSTFTYDTNGKLTKDLGYGGNFWELIPQTGGVIKKSQMGRQTSYLSSYDTSGNFASTETDPQGHVTTRTELLNNGSATDYQYKQEETYVNDDARFGWIHKRFSGSKVTTAGRDDYTNVSQNVQYPDGVSPSPFNFSVLATVTNVNGSSVAENFDNTTKTKTITSSQGVVSKIAYDSYEKPISVKLGTDTPRTFNYNSYGQLVSTSQGSKNQVTYGYNSKGLVSSVTNGRSESTWYNYDLAGRKTSSISSDGRAVQFSYDGNGNITSLTPPSKPTHYFEINAMELSSKYLPPALTGVTNKDTTYGYNLDKQLTSITNPTGDVLSFNYNSTTGLLDSMTAPSALSSNFNFTYFANTNFVSERKGGVGVKQRYTYYGDIMKSEEIATSNTAGLRYGKVSFEFGSNNRINNRTVSDRNDVHSYTAYMNYNTDDQPIQYGDMYLTYQPKTGRLSTTVLGSVKDSYTYDQYGALSKYNATVLGNSVYSYELTRDNMSRIVAKKETVQGVTKSYVYKYDSVGRLTEVIENAVSIASFVYDTNGNRTTTTLNGTSFSSTFDAQDRMLNFGAQTFSYDANGNLIQSISSIGVQADFTRDFNGDANFISYTGDNTTIMGYDSQRRITQKTLNQRGNNDRFVYDHQNRIAASFTTAGVIGNAYYYPTGSHSPDYMSIGYDSYRIIKDHLGSARLVVKAYDGTIMQKLSYNVLGKAVENTNPLFQPFAYAGGFYDEYTKIVRFGARDYDTETGRWLTKDPIGFRAGDTNLYGYVLNDPVNLIDPSGLFDININGQTFVFNGTTALAGIAGFGCGFLVGGPVVGSFAGISTAAAAATLQGVQKNAINILDQPAQPQPPPPTILLRKD